MGVPGLTWAATGAEAAGLIFLQGFAGPRVPRGFYPDGSAGLPIPCTLEEQHLDRLVITAHPTEQGTAITDHSYKLPRQVTIRCGWSDSPSFLDSGLMQIPADIIGGLSATAAAFGGSGGSTINVYSQLLAVQNSRKPISIITGKQTYQNMLIESLAVITDRRSEHALMVTAVCREIILVSSATINVGSQTAPPTQQGNPAVDLGRPAWRSDDPNATLYPTEAAPQNQGLTQLANPSAPPLQEGVTYIGPWTGAPVGP
jgi:hypothetical protein